MRGTPSNGGTSEVPLVMHLVWMETVHHASIYPHADSSAVTDGLVSHQEPWKENNGKIRVKEVGGRGM